MWGKIFVILVTLAMTSAVIAGEKNFWKKEIIELELGLGVGGPIGMIGSKVNTADAVTANMFVRLGSPRWVWTRLETNTVFNHGVGANFLLDLIRTEKITVHILDPGFFWNSNHVPISLVQLPRKIDLTVGAGVDYKIKNLISSPLLNEAFSVGLSWRTYLGQPLDTILVYGNYAKLIFKEHLKGGQLCISASFVW